MKPGVIYVGFLWETHIICSQNISPSVPRKRKDTLKKQYMASMLEKENENIVYKNVWWICNL